ncbi:pyrroloquinoline quinone-dependent dehydrogenase [Phenylobacterium hankyongense]|uniref:Pyrroloquinoline quinone-dependent dehydrogenase n=1 Tax=Phenylobacterium hankyongense TaxID=1813876 RepID=A0A328B1G7_9CAUL|nr:pyrroloquinoline quinone-dependent dehydrogenase [Phenylobacterium hankyongense]RAK60657.1 pyrroloquinoline quinone-dependent dehydrogenase [Phenylobacterium hankyongense]
MFQSKSYAARRLGCASLGVIAAVALGGTALAGPGDWPSVHHDPGGERYSPLTQITPANVSGLKVAWTYHMQTPAAAAAAKAAMERAATAAPTIGPHRTGPTGLRASESIPLVIGTTMYLGTPYGRIVALDSATGKEKWVFELPNGDVPSIRGVSYWPGDGKAPASIVFGTRDGKLMSINAATGKPNPGFGVDGTVNVKTPEVMQTGMDKYYFIPSPPVIYKNLIITGAGMGEGPGGAMAGPGPRGDSRAWDARTGKLVWTFHSVPQPGEKGHETWGGDSWKLRAGVNVWGHMTLDAQRGIVYMPFGAPNNDRVGVDRPGDNLYGSSLVAVDANTGKYLWHFQVVHHDVWDMDTQAPPTLFDVHKNGKVIPAVGTVNKNGLMFILDRVTGKPIFGVEERPVEPGDVPGEKYSPTQPFPVAPEPLSQITVSRDNLYKDTPEHKAYCEKLVDDNNMLLADKPFTAPRLNRYTVNFPGTQGGVNFYGGAVDPKLHLFVVNVNNLAQPMRIVQNPDGSYSNSGPLAGTRRFWDADNHLPCGPLPWGQMVAVDLDTGKIAWRTTLGVTESMPAGHQNTGRPGLGGPITTAAGLTFVAATDDERFRAFDTRTGKELWEDRLPASGYATPMTYSDAKGKQYVAVVATGGSQIGAPLKSDALVVYSLP